MSLKKLIVRRPAAAAFLQLPNRQPQPTDARVATADARRAVDAGRDLRWLVRQPLDEAAALFGRQLRNHLAGFFDGSAHRR